MDLPVQFMDLDTIMTLGGVAAVVFSVVELTKDALKITGWKSLLYAWLLSIALMGVGTLVTEGLTLASGFVAFCNAAIAAMAATGLHQLIKAAKS